MRRFIRFFWGTIVRPGVTFDALAAERTVRWAVMLACLPVLQVWGNMALHAALGLDWLGTRPMLADPTFVGGFGHLRIGLAHWVPVFAGLMPLLTLLNLVLIPGMAQLMSRLWHWVPYWTLFVGAWSFVLQLYYGPNLCSPESSLFDSVHDSAYNQCEAGWSNSSRQGDEACFIELGKASFATTEGYNHERQAR